MKHNKTLKDLNLLDRFLFGHGLYRYTFRKTCREIPGLEIGDGITTIFLNTRGTVTDGVSDELISLLKYFEHTTPDTENRTESIRIQKMQEKIEAIRANEEVGVKLMNAWEEKIYDREDGRKEGLREGMKKGLQAGMEKGFTDAQEQLIAKMKRSLSDEEIARLTDIPLETVKTISAE